MSKFIVLTTQYGDEVAINSDNIIFIDNDKENEKVVGSRLSLYGGTIWVKERIDQILEKIKGEEVDDSI